MVKTYDEDYYSDWYNDNKKVLLIDFADKKLDEFTEYCRNEFKKYCELRE